MDEDSAASIDSTPHDPPAPTDALAAFQARGPHTYRIFVNTCTRFLTVQRGGQGIDATSFATASLDERLLAVDFCASYRTRILDSFGQISERAILDVFFLAANTLSRDGCLETAWFTVLGHVHNYAKTQRLTSLETPIENSSRPRAYDEFLDNGR